MAVCMSAVYLKTCKYETCEFDSEMKLKIKIAGSKVHGVGYRYFLVIRAYGIGLQGFSAMNETVTGAQVVTVLVEGTEDQTAAFQEIVRQERPIHAEVSEISVSEFAGYVGPAFNFFMFCSMVQLNKAIPLLIDMRDDLKDMRSDLRSVKEDIRTLSADRWTQMEHDISAIKARLGMP
jgi:acylphosphatase